jgi:hypothetical protein
MEQQQKDALIEQYKSYGEDHPSYKKLKEAIARGQDEIIDQAVSELEGLEDASKSNTQAAPGSRHSFPLWEALWVISLTTGLYLVTTIAFNQRIAAVLDKIPPGSTNQFIVGETLGGPKPQQASALLLTELHALQPDNVLFVGHQLAKMEIVEFLTALAGTGARVSILIGPDATGKCQISDRNSPLLRYEFTEMRESSVLMRSQVLLAFNNQTKRAIAVVGTCPYDLQEAESSEHLLVVIHDYNECSDLFGYYDRLWQAAKRRR